MPPQLGERGKGYRCFLQPDKPQKRRDVALPVNGPLLTAAVVSTAMPAFVFPKTTGLPKI